MLTINEWFYDRGSINGKVKLGSKTRHILTSAIAKVNGKKLVYGKGLHKGDIITTINGSKYKLGEFVRCSGQP